MKLDELKAGIAYAEKTQDENHILAMGLMLWETRHEILALVEAANVPMRHPTGVVEWMAGVANAKNAFNAKLEAL